LYTRYFTRAIGRMRQIAAKARYAKRNGTRHKDSFKLVAAVLA